MSWRTRKEAKRSINPEGWYMLDISDPLNPAAIRGQYKTQRECEERIERHFGVNPLIVATIGADLIRHGMLLYVCTKRKWGIIVQKYDFTADDTLEDKKRKREAAKQRRENQSSRR